MSKLVVVVGATGGQGGSVIKTLLANPTYKLRGITRNPTSQAAQALTAKGVEMVAADLNDKESLVKAFQGAAIIFAVTNFFEAFSTLGPNPAIEIEYTQGINMAKVASETPTLEHYIWSTLPNSKAISNGTIEIPHMQGKAAVDEYIKSDASLLSKTTFFWASCSGVSMVGEPPHLGQPINRPFEEGPKTAPHRRYEVQTGAPTAPFAGGVKNNLKNFRTNKAIRILLE